MRVVDRDKAWQLRCLSGSHQTRFWTLSPQHRFNAGPELRAGQSARGRDPESPLELSHRSSWESGA